MLRARVGALALLLGAGPVLPAPSAAAGGFYRYVDAAGVTHFTDAPAERGYQKVELPPPSKVRFNRYPGGGEAGARAAGGASLKGQALDSLIAEVARQHGVSSALVKAVIAAESAFDPGAVSEKGAQGLMQLMPGTAELMGVEDPFEPRQNVKGGVRYLRHLLDRFGDTVHAVAAYNAGPETVDRHGGIPPYPETQAYVRRVMSYYHRYHGDLLP